MWTETSREQYRREDLRYASDMTDAERALILPHPPGKKALGRPRVVPLRGVIDALLYFFGRRVRGVCRRAIFRSARPCNVTFMPGRPKGYWKRSISCWSNRLGSAMAAKPASAGVSVGQDHGKRRSARV